ncbi:HAD family hydrolase [Gorillibacterium timonense]|uniref:HAD family hydrolase n=1 Tax=Gorillibacterium timonense TaxID=1689269 RepID=UPI00071D56D8|nr:HAD family hydrolase [Gorillibacterium timonense]
METQTPPVRGIFFDVDDTLYDHLVPFRQAVEALLGKNDLFPYEEAYHRMRYYSDTLSAASGGAGAMEGSPAMEVMRRDRFQLAFREFGVELSSEQAAAMQAEYLGGQYRLQPFPGMRELIERLIADGRVVGLITNGPKLHQKNKIHALGLDGLIPPGNWFISAEVGWDKPDPRIFTYANECTGTDASECVYIGDTWRNDVIGALAAGWRVIWFNHRGVEPESEGTPTYTAASCEELARLLLNQAE